ncbi:unnamed protein product [Camellia sinensis]
MMNGKKTLAEAAIQLPETKVAAAAEESVTNSGSLESARRKLELIHIVLRLACLSTAVASLSLMATAEEASTVSIYGFSLPIYSKWSFADSFVYLVGVSAAAAAHSVVQFLISTSRLLHKSPVIPSRTHAWIIFAGDQGLDFWGNVAGICICNDECWISCIRRNEPEPHRNQTFGFTKFLQALTQLLRPCCCFHSLHFCQLRLAHCLNCG